MSRYNTVTARITCPTCHRDGSVTAFVFESLGCLNCIEHAIGDAVRWMPFDSVREGGRPPEGCVDAPGWAECPGCGAGLAVAVLVRGDRVAGVSVEAQASDG